MLTLRISAFDRLRALIGQKTHTVGSKNGPTVFNQPNATRPFEPLTPLVSEKDRQQAAVIVQQLIAQLPYALAVAVLHAQADIPLAHAGIHRQVSPASLAVQFGRIARKAGEMMTAMVPQEGDVQEMICASETEFYLLMPIGDLSWWLFLAIETKDTNMAIVRSLMQATVTSFKRVGPENSSS